MLPTAATTSTLVSRLQQRAGASDILFSSDPASLGQEDLRKLHKPAVLVQDYPESTKISEALEQSYDTLLQYRPSLAIAHYPDSGKAILITLEKGLVPVNNFASLATWLDKLLQSRIKQEHYDTDTYLTKVTELETKTDLDELQKLTETLSTWSLFPKFQLTNEQTKLRSERYPGARFGFVAKRTTQGTLITARGSNKGTPSEKDFALVTAIDGKQVHTKTIERKASLNAPLAHKIFEARPEINYIVHSHILLPKGINATNISAPDTEADWKSIAELVQQGAQVINQPQHGTLILLRNPDELLPILLRNNTYNSRADLYETEYRRFLEEDFLTRIVNDSGTPKTAKVLDLCCGTGASTEALVQLGFKDIDIADGSQGMLRQAEQKLGRNGKIISLPNLDPLTSTYDLITMRQAFNYIRPTDLNTFAWNIAQRLNPNGKFVFTTFAELEPGLRIRENPDWQNDNRWIRTSESNIISKEAIMHTQRTELLDFDKELWSPVLDINIFYQYNADQIAKAFRATGLEVKYTQEANRICFTCSKGMSL